MHGTCGLINPWHHMRKMSSWVGNPGRPPYVRPRRSAGLKKNSDGTLTSRRTDGGKKERVQACAMCTGKDVKYFQIVIQVNCDIKHL